ncbi:DUF3795 domain-containing protein [Oscillibacter sp. MSJ-2]|uniref:DUF3795 domain-containing protein n=1 Tax=Dysosmobacter acutus TaxID=2841504 RepID=A0ABS6FDF1_9FIRM|nr:DUF3795 domain-containing protein [Dysosmobacter acutus]MBU5627354.1 DUF3795 domain-containing protein [Dysosmobacter acutus]
MKGFWRDNLLFSLCGLNCGLCPMRLGGYCPGCGGGEGNQSCAIARCSLAHGGLEYCYECGAFPCERYEDIDQFDSFITHKNRRRDIERASEAGMEAYCARQREKTAVLQELLTHYNDGRRKTLFCTAVNLLELEDVRAVAEKLQGHAWPEGTSLKEKAAHAAFLFQDTARRRDIDLALRKKKKS